MPFTFKFPFFFDDNTKPASALKQMILGQQSTFNTSVAATWKVMGLEDAAINIDSKAIVPKVLGTLSPGPLGSQVIQGARARMTGSATYEDLRYVLNGCYSAVTVSPSSAAPYAYSYGAPTNSTQTHSIYSVQWGTTAVAYSMVGAVETDYYLRGVAGEMWKFNSQYVGKNVQTSTSPTSVGDHAITPLRMADTSLYIDAFSTGTAGATSFPAMLIGFDLNYRTGRQPITYAGALSPQNYTEGRHEVTLSILADFNAKSKAIIDALLSTDSDPASQIAQYQLRIEALTGSGANQSRARIDFAGTLSSGTKLFEDRDGSVTALLDFEGQYSTALGNSLKILVECPSSACP